MNIFGELATEIVNDEFDYLTGSDMSGQIVSASGWLSGNVGILNTLLHQSFSGENPEIDEEAQAIFKLSYLSSYYRRKMQATLRGIDSSVDWITIREGDSSMTKTNKNEVAKSWRGMANDASAELQKLVDSYKIYDAAPVEVNHNEG